MSTSPITASPRNLPRRRANDEPWIKHRPVWTEEPNPVFPDERQLLQCSCGAFPGEQDYEPAWFGGHLETVGAPPYMVLYWQHWASVIEAPCGSIDRDAVARELADYDALMACTSTVYGELADLSKPTTDPAYILERAAENFRARHAYALCARAAAAASDDRQHGAAIADALRDLAEEWHSGAWAEFQDTRRHLPAVEAGRQALTT